MGKYTPETAAHYNALTARYRNDPKTRARYLARKKAQHAIALGLLVRKPCEACGAAEAHAHHDDYSKPLEVRWLCPVHHAEYHRRAGLRTHCPHGHALTGDNLIVRRHGWRECRACKREEGKRYRARKKAGAV
jgi:hypothetical protein